MSQWEPASNLSRFNRSARSEWQEVPEEFATVLDAALAVAAASEGAFDPCLGRLSELWGFGSAGPVGAVPKAESIHAARRAPAAIEFDREACRVPIGRASCRERVCQYV